MRSSQHGITTVVLPRREIVLAAGFACLLLVGLIGCKLSHGPFIDRYFLSSVAGYAIFVGFASSPRYLGSWTAKALALCTFVLMLADLGATIHLGVNHRTVLMEPSCGLRLSTTPSDPMALYGILSTNNSGQDVLVLSELEYIYFFRYAQPSVVSHLYYGAPAGEVFLSAYRRLAKEAHIDLKTTSLEPFLAAHKRFLLYESWTTDVENAKIAIPAIAGDGYRLKFAQADVSGILYEYEK
jgi:hypothetical protein